MELTGKEMDFCTDTARKITDNVARAVVGKKECTRLLLCCLLCGGHALLQDVPGVGKTAAVNAFAASLDMDFRRIQCTPDMLPADILGFTVYDANTGKGSFCPGPIMSRLFLADEINRSSPKTQAALLEAMEEGRITVDGQDHILPRPFMVLATQNPIESVGTYPLPEAQMDRFMMRISFGYPDKEEEKDILRRYGQGDPLGTLRPVAKAEDIIAMRNAAERVYVSQAAADYIVNITRATRSNSLVRLGASPRASLALMKCARAYALTNGRDYIIPDDVRLLAPAVLAHRLILSREAAAKGMSKEDALMEIVSAIPVQV